MVKTVLMAVVMALKELRNLGWYYKIVVVSKDHVKNPLLANIFTTKKKT